MLFVTVGSSIDFSTLADGTVGKSCAIVCAGALHTPTVAWEAGGEQWRATHWAVCIACMPSGPQVPHLRRLCLASTQRVANSPRLSSPLSNLARVLPHCCPQNLLAGLGLRAVITFFSMIGLHHSVKERLFLAFAWTPKATLQAALSGARGIQ